MFAYVSDNVSHEIRLGSCRATSIRSLAVHRRLLFLWVWFLVQTDARFGVPGARLCVSDVTDRTSLPGFIPRHALHPLHMIPALRSSQEHTLDDVPWPVVVEACGVTLV